MESSQQQDVELYSSRQELSVLLQSLDLHELMDLVSACGETSGKADMDPSTAALRVLYYAAQAVKGSSVSSSSLAGESVPCSQLLGETAFPTAAALPLSSTTTDAGARPSGVPSASSAGTEARQRFRFVTAGVCTALAQYYAGFVTGEHWNTDSTPMTTVRDGVAVALAITKTWTTAAAALMKERVGCAKPPDDAEETMPSAGEEFLTRLFEYADGPTPNSGPDCSIAEVALLFARAHYPALSQSSWTVFRQLARHAHQLKQSAGTTDAYQAGRLSLESIAARALIIVFCDSAITPLVNALAERSGVTAEAAPSPCTIPAQSAFMPPTRICESLRASFDALQESGIPELGQLRRCQLALLLSDAYFVFLLKPYPSLVADFLLAEKL